MKKSSGDKTRESDWDQSFQNKDKDFGNLGSQNHVTILVVWE